jgi:hypothetical protein
MARYELFECKTNGNPDFLLVRDGQVISRWADVSDSAKWDRLAHSPVWDELDKWDDQAAAGADMSDYQADLDAGRYNSVVRLAIEIDGHHPRYAASDAVSAARGELNLTTRADYGDATTSVARLLIDGTLPEWYGSINWYAKQAAERAARNLGVWPYANA